jgi:hypothetical protein
MGGERTTDNCYGLAGLTEDPQIFCNKATIDDSELWHQRLGHLNFSEMLLKACPKWRRLKKESVGLVS